jgi:acetoin utilization deacetylase AcuC-like enzyme
MTIGLIDDPMFLKHAPPFEHPENPGRLEAIQKQLQQLKLYERCLLLPLREVTDEEILLVHTPALLEKLRATQKEKFTQLDADTYANQDSFMVARFAAGSLLSAIDHLVRKQIDTALILSRPPGHHAEADRAMGFCLLNNVAIAAAYALKQHSFKRVAIIDWDVHHGNGTQKIFYGSSQVLYISTHQFPLYPGGGIPSEIGSNDGVGYNINFPLPANLPEAEVLNLYQHVIVPTIQKFSPDLLLISAGFDAHRDDPLAQMEMTTAGFCQLSVLVESLRGLLPELKTAYILEGGYNVGALTDCIVNLLQQWTSTSVPPPMIVASAPDQRTLFVQQLLKTFPVDLINRWGW